MTIIQVVAATLSRCSWYTLTFLVTRGVMFTCIRAFPLKPFLHFKYAVFVLVKADKVEVQILYPVLI